MITSYSISNFRIFNEEGVKINLTPITILTGCNSSGKSSIVKSLLLIEDLIRQGKRDLLENNRFQPWEYHMDFHKSDLKLGSFDSSLHRQTSNKEMVFSYSIEPSCCGFAYRVEYTIGKRDEDSLGKGWIKRIRITDMDGIVVFEAISKKPSTLTPVVIRLSNDFQADITFFITAVIENFYKQKIVSCYNPYGEIENDTNYSKWMRALDDFTRSYDENKICLSYFKNALDNLDDKMSKPLLDFDLSNSYKKLMEHSLFFYFPVLEELVGKGKQSSIDILKAVTSGDLLETIKREKFCNKKQRIIDDFQNSNFDSFIDYYRSFENSHIENLVKEVYPFIKSNEGFINDMKEYSKVYYDSDNGINILFSPSKDVIGFADIYEFLSIWQWKESEGHDDDFICRSRNADWMTAHHRLYDAINCYFGLFLKECLLPDIFDGIKYIGNFHSEVKRLYSFDDDSGMSNILERFLYLETKYRSLLSSGFKVKNRYKSLSFTNKWLKRLKLGTALKIVTDTDGLGAKIYLTKYKDQSRVPLADEGYGISQIVNFLLNIEVEILDKEVFLQENQNNKPARPVTTLAIEEPEVSLHPSMQSSLTDIFLDAYNNYNIHFIIETHSEYLIRRSQAIVANYKTVKEFENKPFSVYYIEKGGNAYDLEYMESGRFAKAFGTGFFDEAGKSSIAVLKRERRKRK